jgi:hypothetical protein
MSDPASPLTDLTYATNRVGSGRIGRLVVAYVAAVAAAAVARTFGLVVEETWIAGFGHLVAVNGWSSLLVVPAMTGLIGFVTAAPFATAFLVFAEGRGVRGLGPYLAAGAAIAVATQAILTVPFGVSAAGGGLYLLDAVAGAVGGWVGWLVGVRSAPPPPRLPPWAEV